MVMQLPFRVIFFYWITLLFNDQSLFFSLLPSVWFCKWITLKAENYIGFLASKSLIYGHWGLKKKLIILWLNIHLNISKVLNELMTYFNSQIIFTLCIYSVGLLGRKYCMILFWFCSSVLFRMPVSIKIFGSFIFLREEQCDWIIVLPFIAVSALKFRAVDWVLFQQNSQCASQLRTETGISKRGHSCDFTKIPPWAGKASAGLWAQLRTVIYAKGRSALAAVSYCWVLRSAVHFILSCRGRILLLFTVMVQWKRCFMVPQTINWGTLPRN